MTSQIPPVGPHHPIDVLFVGAVLWAQPAEATTALRAVVDDDIESPILAEVLAAIRRLNAAGVHGPQLVLDELRRRGEPSYPVAQALREATTCGADPSAALYYAAAVVAGSLRRRVESFGVALTAAAREAREDELAPAVNHAVRIISDCAVRLRSLRGDES